jgi:hypothetical protein
VSSPDDFPEKRPSFVSTQVSEARRYYLDLSAKPGPGVVVVCGGCERMRPDYRVQRSTFPFLAVEFVAEGEGALELAGHRYALRPGMAFAYGPGAAHVIRNEPKRPMLKYYIDFAGGDAERLLGESALGGWRAVQVSSPPEVVEGRTSSQGSSRANRSERSLAPCCSSSCCSCSLRRAGDEEEDDAVDLAAFGLDWDSTDDSRLCRRPRRLIRRRRPAA